MCRADAGICDVADFCSGNPDESCVNLKEACAFVTDSSLCPFDISANKGFCSGGSDDGTSCFVGDANDPCVLNGGTCDQSGEFGLAFTPSLAGSSSYMLTTSNPSLYVYNLIVDGDPGTVTPVSIEIPYPFVTQGEMPVQVFDAVDVDIDPENCFEPATPIESFGQQVVIEDYIGGASVGGGSTLSCDQVGCGLDGAGICTFEVDVSIPDSGQAYVNVNLDYGLKGDVDANDGTPVTPGEITCDASLDSYAQGAMDAVFGGWDALVNGLNPTGDVALENCKLYEFAHQCLGPNCSDSGLFGDQVQSLNVFPAICSDPSVPDCDGDGLANEFDTCPFFFDPDQLDTNDDGIGDECQCGDVNGDGAISGPDIGGMAVCANGSTVLTCDSTIADADGDGAITALDIAGVVAVTNGDAETSELDCARANPAP